MTRFLLLALALWLAACAVHNDTPLPMVQPGDPTWPLVPDRLVWGQLPQ